MHNELCERLGIEFPIFAFTHCRDVAAAVSNAGGLGVLGAVGFSAEELEVELTWLDEHVGDHGVPEIEGGPRRELLGWTAATAAPLVEVILRHEKVALVANALGTPPDDVIEQVH